MMSEVRPLDEKTYVKEAEKVIGSLGRDKFDNIQLTASQIRNILTMINELYNAVRYSKDEILSDELQSRTQYIKMRIAYNAGRDSKVKDLVQKSHIMEYLDDVGDSKKKLVLVCHYAEALVAYHKFSGGKD